MGGWKQGRKEGRNEGTKEGMRKAHTVMRQHSPDRFQMLAEELTVATFLTAFEILTLQPRPKCSYRSSKELFMQQMDTITRKSQPAKRRELTLECPAPVAAPETHPITQGQRGGCRKIGKCLLSN